MTKGQLTSSQINEAITTALHNLQVNFEGAQLVLLDATDPIEPTNFDTVEALESWYGQDSEEAKKYGFPVVSEPNSGWKEE